MQNYLKCHTGGDWHSTGEEFCSEDRKYRIIQEDEYYYGFIDNQGKVNYVSKDVTDESYFGIWFYVY